MDHYLTSILKAIKYAEKKLKSELSLEELARVAAFSKFHFSRIFKAITKESATEYIRKRKLTLAAIDLIDTNIPLLQIALTYGYTSQEAFTRAFANYIGTSPLRYRKRGVHFVIVLSSLVVSTSRIIGDL